MILKLTQTMNIANQRTYYTCIVVHMGQTGSSIQSWSANLIKGGASKRGLKTGSQKPGPVRCLMDTPAAVERWVGFWLSLRQQQLQLLLNSPSLHTPLLTLETLNQNKTPPTLSLLQKKESYVVDLYTSSGNNQGDQNDDEYSCSYQCNDLQVSFTP
jgi:hypothetical protein